MSEVDASVGVTPRSTTRRVMGAMARTGWMRWERLEGWLRRVRRGHGDAGAGRARPGLVSLRRPSGPRVPPVQKILDVMSERRDMLAAGG